MRSAGTRRNAVDKQGACFEIQAKQPTSVRTNLLMKAKSCFVSVACSLLTLVSLEAKERKVPIASPVDKLTLKDIHYLPRTLDDIVDAKSYVIAFTITSSIFAQR